MRMSGPTQLTASDVAARLGVSVARVRQLVDERKLAEPRKYGTRASLWDIADVRTFQVVAGGGAITGQASLVTTAMAPLTRTHDVVIPVFRPSARSAAWLAHVRVWEGTVEGDPRIVVILARTQDSPYADARIEEIVETVDNRLLGGRGRDAIWVETYLSDTRDRSFEAANLVLTLTDTLTRSERRDLLWKKRRYANPIWVPMALHSVDALVGEPVEWWPHGTYSPKSIEAWHRTKTTVEVSPVGTQLQELHVDGHILLDAAAEIGDRDDVVAQAVTHAEAIAAHRAVEPRHCEWDDGTRPPADYAGEWPTRFAAVLTPYTPASNDLVALPSLHALERVVDLFQEWIEGLPVDSLAASAAADRVLDLLQTQLWEHEDATAGAADGAIRTFAAAGDLDRNYLAQIDTSPGLSSVSELGARIAALTDTSVQYGVDPFGNAVAFSDGGEYFAVRWPTHPSSPFPPGGELVSSGVLPDEVAVDRPVYVQVDGRITGLLACDPESARLGWSFGYHGSSPLALAADMSRHLTYTQPGVRAPDAWLLDQIQHSDATLLRIRVDDILRRTASV